MRYAMPIERVMPRMGNGATRRLSHSNTDGYVKTPGSDTRRIQPRMQGFFGYVCTLFVQSDQFVGNFGFYGAAIEIKEAGSFEVAAGAGVDIAAIVSEDFVGSE